MQYVDQLSKLWKDESQQNFTTIAHKYQHKIVFYLGAHLHTADIRAPHASINATDINMTLLLTPSVSPYHQNNPGYTIMDFNITSTLIGVLIKGSMTMRFFQLGEYVMLHQENWITTNLEELFNFKVTDPLSVTNFVSSMKSDHAAYARYTVTRLGYRAELANLASFSHQAFNIFINRYKALNYLCAMENFEEAGYNHCIGAKPAALMSFLQ